MAITLSSSRCVHVAVADGGGVVERMCMFGLFAPRLWPWMWDEGLCQVRRRTKP